MKKIVLLLLLHLIPFSIMSMDQDFLKLVKEFKEIFENPKNLESFSDAERQKVIACSTGIHIYLSSGIVCPKTGEFIHVDFLFNDGMPYDAGLPSIEQVTNSVQSRLIIQIPTESKTVNLSPITVAAEASSDNFVLSTRSGRKSKRTFAYREYIKSQSKDLGKRIKSE